VTAVTDPLNHTTSVGRNSLGDVTSVTNALNQTSVFTYGNLGELLTATDPMSHQTVLTRDGATRVTAVRDANLKTVQTAYNGNDEVTSVTQTLNGNPVTTTLGYDLNGNRISLVDANSKTWQWVVDSMDRVQKSVNPLGEEVRYEFDANSNVQARVDRKGQRWEYERALGMGDRLDRILFKNAGGAEESRVTFTYDTTSKLLTSCTDTAPGAGTCSWAYDPIDRLTAVTTAGGTISYTLEDKVNRLKEMQVPGQGLIAYGYDNADNAISVSQNAQQSQFCYDPLNRMCQRILPNSVTTDWAFNAAGFVTSILSKKSGVTFDSHTFTGDNVGNVLTEAVNGFTNQYGYDDLYRLVSTTDQTGNYAWAYDNVGNRASQTLNGQQTSFTRNNAYRLTAVGGVPVTMDPNGNLTSFSGESYSWNSRNQLAATSKPGYTASFCYDTNGFRKQQTVNGVTTSFLLNGGQCLKETTGGTAVNVLYGADGGVLTRNGRWFTPDDQGTGTLTDTAGNLTQRYTYGPFGARERGPGPPLRRCAPVPPPLSPAGPKRGSPVPAWGSMP
jgi:YD repeat-containing protein